MPLPVVSRMYFLLVAPPDTFAAVRPAALGDVAKIDGDRRQIRFDRFACADRTRRAPHPLERFDRNPSAREHRREHERQTHCVTRGCFMRWRPTRRGMKSVAPEDPATGRRASAPWWRRHQRAWRFPAPARRFPARPAESPAARPRLRRERDTACDCDTPAPSPHSARRNRPAARHRRTNPTGSSTSGLWSDARGCEKSSMLLNGRNLCRTPKRVTSIRGCARRSAWTAAHSTNVLLTKSVPFPVRNTSRTNACRISAE